MSLQISIVVNGRERQLSIDPRLTLVHMLRETLGLTGAHVGCMISSTSGTSTSRVTPPRCASKIASAARPDVTVATAIFSLALSHAPVD